MKQISPNKATFTLFPGAIRYLSDHPHPDGLINKLIMDHRQARRVFMSKVSTAFCILIIGVMLGYGWRMYHESIPAPAVAEIMYYPDIAIDLTYLRPVMGQISYTETAKREWTQ